jgi:hypothetical protein
MDKPSRWKMISGAAVLALGICVSWGGTFAGQDDGDVNGTTASPSAVTPLPVTAKATKGSVKCTAAINSDASVLSCNHCNPADTNHIGTGRYQVGFSKPCQNILAVNGWSRWVQADVLNDSSENAYCTTADRSGDVNAVYVQCQNAGGLVNASFFLFVAK